MITERIRFEILQDKSTNNIDVHTKALVVFGKIVYLNPIQKFMAYHNTNTSDYPLLHDRRLKLGVSISDVKP